MKLHTIAFDADDTLWQNEKYYRSAKETFSLLMATYLPAGDAAARLDEIEDHNVGWYGYGIKSFMLSMVEAAVEMTAGKVACGEIEAILRIGKEMLSQKVEVYREAEVILAELSQDWDLMLITKGDLLEQGRKVERSGLAKYFKHIEIVQDKTPAVYETLLRKHSLSAGGFLMVGNSLRSDILPVVAVGGQAVFIPQENTWAHENVNPADLPRGYFEVEHLGRLPALMERIAAL